MNSVKINTVKFAYRFVRWKIAQAWLALHPEADIIGVAGSVGKTTTKEVVASILSEQFKVIKTTANFDPIFNLPITALKARKNTKFVAELSVDQIGQMDKYLTLVKPRIGIITKLSIEHSDNDHFCSYEGAIEEEVKLIRSLPGYGWLITNGDDELTKEKSRLSKTQTLFCGFCQDNDLQIINFRQEIVDGRISSNFTVRTGNNQHSIVTHLLGKHNALLISYGIAVGITCGLGFAEIQKGILNIYPVEHRLQAKKSKWGVVIDDTYNAIPAAVEGAIDVLTDLDKKNPTLVLGEMKELGKYSKDLHYQIGRYAKDKGVKRLVVIGDHAADVVHGFGGGKDTNMVATSHKEIIRWLKEVRPPIVLVKGSRSMKMEGVVDAICA